MNHEYFKHRIADASSETLKLLSYVSDLKTERGVTSSEAKDLITRYREIERIRCASEKVGGSSLRGYSDSFIEKFSSDMPQIFESVLCFEIARRSTIQNWSLLHLTLGRLKNDSWFSLAFFDALDPSSTLCSVRGCFSCEDTLSKFSNVLEFVQRLAGQDRDQVLRKKCRGGVKALIPLVKATFAGLTFEIHNSNGGIRTANLSEVVDQLLLNMACRPTKGQVLELMGAHDLEPVKTEKKALEALRAHEIDTFKFHIEMSMSELAGSLSSGPALTPNVLPQNLYQRFKNEMIERTIWAERRVAMAILDSVLARGNAPESVEQLLEREIVGFREGAKSSRKQFNVFEAAQSDGTLPRSYAARMRNVLASRLEFENYAAVILVKNRKFLTEFYSR